MAFTVPWVSLFHFASQSHPNPLSEKFILHLKDSIGEGNPFQDNPKPLFIVGSYVSKVWFCWTRQIMQQWERKGNKQIIIQLYKARLEPWLCVCMGKLFGDPQPEQTKKRWVRERSLRNGCQGQEHWTWKVILLLLQLILWVLERLDYDKITKSAFGKMENKQKQCFN